MAPKKRKAEDEDAEPSKANKKTKTKPSGSTSKTGLGGDAKDTKATSKSPTKAGKSPKKTGKSPAEAGKSLTKDKDPKDSDSLGAASNTDPCAAFLQALLSMRSKGTATRPKQDLELEDVNSQELPMNDVNDSISSIVKAVNQHLQNSGRIKFLTLAGKASAADPTERNDVVIDTHRHESHMVLIVAHRSERSGGDIRVDVVDSAPWTFDLAQRQSIHDEFQTNLTKTTSTDASSLPDRTGWRRAALQLEPWQAPYYTVLNAWSMLLGMTLNLDFHPEPRFFAMAREIIQATIHGTANAELIWNFLRCFKFSYSTMLPPRLQFVSAVPAIATTATTAASATGITLSPTALSSTDDFFRSFFSPRQAHNDDFIWDGRDQEDIRVRIPALQLADVFNPKMTPSKWRDVFNATTSYHKVQRDLNDTDSSSDPCKNFQDAMAELKKSHDLVNRLARLRADKREAHLVTTDRTLWMRDDEVSIAIASVVLAITMAQDVTGGFNVIESEQVSLAGAGPPGEGVLPPPPLIRPGRPMIVPIAHNQHIVLMVIQMDAAGQPTMSVFDSRPWLHADDARSHIHQIGLTLVRITGWWQGYLPECPSIKHIPKAEWLMCAQQPTSRECGYFAILNAWALALGLTINPDFDMDWDNGNFFSEVKDVIHAVRLGLADWRLIYDFLRCRQFVKDGEVPESRRFANTLEMLTEASIGHFLEHMLLEDQTFQSHRDTQGVDVTAIAQRNRLNLPSSDTRSRTDPNPVQFGPTQGPSALLPIKVGKNPPSASSFAQHTSKKFAELSKSAGGTSESGLFSSYQSTMQVSTSEALTDFYKQFDKNTCALSNAGLAFFESLRKQKNTKSLFQDSTLTPDGGLMVNDEVNIAIASVVQAIDARQSANHPSNSAFPFSGGFTLATSSDVQTSAVTALAFPMLSRPRRCWFLPTTFSMLDKRNRELKAKGKPALLWWDPKKEGGPDLEHHVLVVLQEVRDATGSNPRFQINILDSSSNSQSSMLNRDLICEKVVTSAYNIGWVTHRNATTPASAQRIEFDDQDVRFVHVSQQTNGTDCGRHVILNAWILALGLRPNPLRLFTPQMYDELNRLIRAAISGLLHWQTLTAWLFCRGLVVGTKTSNNIPDRARFGLTVRQDRFENNITVYSQQVYYDTDVPLGTLPETFAPYDHTNNIALPTGSFVSRTVASLDPTSLGIS